MKNKTGLGRWWSASIFSWQGFRDTYKTEEGFRQETWVGMVLIPLSFFVADSVIEWLLLVLTYLTILLAEMLNTAMEATVNRFGTEWNELTGKAKDAGSAAVMIAIIMTVITWGAILFT
ncbi:MAG: diacylglycerol kinase [Gammaproteobacteria bacterium]|nr:MAG: diacylglycerol kinase [Gammaproteobacteria bacterium]